MCRSPPPPARGRVQAPPYLHAAVSRSPPTCTPPRPGAPPPARRRVQVPPPPARRRVQAPPHLHAAVSSRPPTCTPLCPGATPSTRRLLLHHQTRHFLKRSESCARVQASSISPAPQARSTRSPSTCLTGSLHHPPRRDPLPLFLLLVL